MADNFWPNDAQWALKRIVSGPLLWFIGDKGCDQLEELRPRLFQRGGDPRVRAPRGDALCSQATDFRC